MEQATADAVELVGRMHRAGVTEEIEGLPLELLLALQHRLVSSDRGMLLEASRVLQRMPVTKTLFAEGRLSWGQVRGIVARLRRLRVEDLASIDERVCASVELVDKLSPDELVWAVERASDEIDGARKVYRREERAVAASFLAIQPSFDGSVRLYGELDPLAGATCLDALEAPAGPRRLSRGKLGRLRVGRGGVPKGSYAYAVIGLAATAVGQPVPCWSPTSTWPTSRRPQRGRWSWLLRECYPRSPPPLLKPLRRMLTCAS